MRLLNQNTSTRLATLATALSVACSGAPKSDPQAKQADPPGAQSAKAPDTSLTRADKARIQGSESAKVWLVMSSDFQCPYCKDFHDKTFPQILRDYVSTGKVRVAFLNHPMEFHQFAIPGAEAAMCAGTQDRFWEMHDALFATQGNWTKRSDPQPVFDSLATALKLRMDDWRACYSTHAMRAMIENDFFKSKRGGVTGTPSFFIGDRLAVQGAEEYPTFRKALDAAIAQAGPPRP